MPLASKERDDDGAFGRNVDPLTKLLFHGFDSFSCGFPRQRAKFLRREERKTTVAERDLADSQQR